MIFKTNPSLAYEVLMYLNSFYFGLFAPSELGMGLLKAINWGSQKNPDYNKLICDSTILLLFCVLETIRIILGRKGALCDNGWQVKTSVGLMLPSILGDIFLIYFQYWKLKLEYALVSLLLALHLTEVYYCIAFFLSLLKPVTYT